MKRTRAKSPICILSVHFQVYGMETLFRFVDCAALFGRGDFLFTTCGTPLFRVPVPSLRSSCVLSDSLPPFLILSLPGATCMPGNKPVPDPVFYVRFSRSQLKHRPKIAFLFEYTIQITKKNDVFTYYPSVHPARRLKRASPTFYC